MLGVPRMHHPKPEEVISFDPDEFIGALEYANMVAEHEFLEEVPAIGKPLVKTDEGTFALANNPDNLFGLAIARHFRKQQDKIFSFFYRWWAFQKLSRHRSMKKFIRGSGDHREIHHAVFEATATQPLTAKYEFVPREFFAAVREIAKRMDADKSK